MFTPSVVVIVGIESLHLPWQIGREGSGLFYRSQRPCTFEPMLLRHSEDVNGASTSALFHRCRRGRQLPDRCPAAAQYIAALFEPADSRSGIRSWGATPGAAGARRDADRCRTGVSRSRTVGAVAGRGSDRWRAAN